MTLKRQMKRRTIIAMCLAHKVKNNASDKSLEEDFKRWNVIYKFSFNKLPTEHHGVKKMLMDLMPFDREYIVYCPACQRLVAYANERIQKVFCSSCRTMLDPSKDHCQFIRLSIRDQIKSYLELGKLPLLLRRAAKIPRMLVSGELHEGMKFPETLDLMMGCDEIPVTEKSTIQAFPAVIFFNGIPATYHLRFPVLAGVFVGPTSHVPPRRIFFRRIQEELRDLALNPICWLEGQTPRQTKAYVTIFQGDGKEASTCMSLNPQSGRFSCRTCYARGTQLGNFVDAGSSKIVFPARVHQRDAPKIRTEKEFLEQAKKAAEARIAGNALPPEKNYGVLCFPAFYDMPNFDLIKSTTPDNLHVLCEGLVKKMLIFSSQLARPGHPDSFLGTGQSFTGEQWLLKGTPS